MKEKRGRQNLEPVSKRATGHIEIAIRVVPPSSAGAYSLIGAWICAYTKDDPGRNLRWSKQKYLDLLARPEVQLRSVGLSAESSTRGLIPEIKEAWAVEMSPDSRP